MLKKTILLVLFLGIVSAISGLGISYVNGITKPIIDEKAIAAEKANLELMFPNAEFAAIEYKGDASGILGVYEVKGKGYVIKTEGKGYSSTLINALIGLDNDGTVLDVVILSHGETSGFGSKCFEKDFINSGYVGKKLDQDVSMISGATLTSQAMANMISSARLVYAEVNK